MAIVKNTKNKLLSVLFFLIVAGLYNLILFLIMNGHEKTTQFWISYGFVMGAMCLFGLSVYSAFFRERRKGPFGLPFIFMAGIYLAVEFILGHILMAIKSAPVPAVLIPQTVLFLLYLLFMIPALMGLNYIKDREAVVKKKVFYLRDLRTELDVAAASVSDAGLKKSLQSLAEDLFCSDPMTSPELARVEDKIKTYVYEIRDTAESGNIAPLSELIQKVKVLLTERNEKCKVLK